MSFQFTSSSASSGNSGNQNYASFNTTTENDIETVDVSSYTINESFKAEVGVAKHIENFKFIKPISRGTYGKVFLGYRKDKPDVLYAIKAIKKEDLVRKNMVNSVHIERKAFCLSAADPFCVRLLYSLQTSKTVYLVMEYMIGGDLKSLLSIMGYFDIRAAAFYTAEISLALDFIHKCGVVHRDVKPDNVLIDARGHVKLTDFGLSRVSMESDLTPRRMTNFTPGQLMSLKTEFCFPTAIPVVSKSLEIHPLIEQVRGNENSVSGSCDMLTPLCPQESSSIITQNRRYRKPLRKLRNVENKAVIPMPSLGKLSPELPRIDLSEWSVIQTPKEFKPKYVEYGSFVNITFNTPTPSPKISPEIESARVREFVHHSSPIDPDSTKEPISVISPLLPLDTPYSSNTYNYERSENPAKRHRFRESINVGEKLKVGVESMDIAVTITTMEEDTQSHIADSAHLGCITMNSETETFHGSNLEVTPEMVRRDHMHTMNYMKVENLNYTRTVPVKIPAEIHSDNSSVLNISTKKPSSALFKRKRWIQSSSSRPHTGISANMRKLALGSTVSFPTGSSDASTASSGEKNKSPPNGSGARIVGTPDYLAPEIIAKQPHGPAVDWWSLGVCLYEFIVGCLPFSAESLSSIFHNIEIRDLEFPPDTDPAIQKCIELLLDLDPDKRPSLARLRSSEFQGFFGDLPWDNMSQAQPPFIPTPTSPTDTAYFNPRNEEQNITVSGNVSPQ